MNSKKVIAFGGYRTPSNFKPPRGHETVRSSLAKLILVRIGSTLVSFQIAPTDGDIPDRFPTPIYLRTNSGH